MKCARRPQRGDTVGGWRCSAIPCTGFIKKKYIKIQIGEKKHDAVYWIVYQGRGGGGKINIYLYKKCLVVSTTKSLQYRQWG